MDLRNSPGEFVIQFIETYKDNPCLWNGATLDYRDRSKKKAGYKSLMNVMKLYHDNVTLQDVKKKINSIRASFRREERKKSKYLLKGRIYKPKLWYYEMLSFLEEVIFSTPSNKYLEVSVESDDDNDIDFSRNVVSADDDFDDSMPSPAPSPEPSRKLPPAVPKKKIKQESLENTHENCEDEFEIIDELGIISHTNCDDEFDIIGKCFANKLRRIAGLSRERVSIAEKLINDILFQAEFEDISKDARIVNLPRPPKDENKVTELKNVSSYDDCPAIIVTKD